MATTLLAKWTWADAGFVNHGLAKRIPLWWSYMQSIEDTIANLETYHSSRPNRPIKVCVSSTSACSAEEDRTRSASSGSSLGRKGSSSFGGKEIHEQHVELQCEFHDIAKAMAGLKDFLPSSQSFSNCVMEDGSGEDLSWILKSFCNKLVEQVSVVVRWSWDENTLWCASWCALEKAAETLKEESLIDRVEEGITLQIKASLRDRTKVRYNAQLETTFEAAVLLEEVVNLSIKPAAGHRDADASSSEGAQRSAADAPPPPPTGTMPHPAGAPPAALVALLEGDSSAPCATIGGATRGLPALGLDSYLLSPDALEYKDLEGLGYETPTWMQEQMPNSTGIYFPEMDSRRLSLGAAAEAGEQAAPATIDTSHMDSSYVMDLTALRSSPDASG